MTINIDDNVTLTRIKGRYIVFLWFLPFFYFIGYGQTISQMLIDEPWYWVDVSFVYISIAQLMLVIIILGAYGRLNWKVMMGNNPTITECIPAFKLTAFIYIFSIAAIYALFIPLSHVLPDFVQWWYIDIPPIIYYEGDSYLLKPNVLNFLALVVFAPVIEEILFRGMLLHRWSHKWGMVKAVVLSSLVFGAIHPDPIGATAFGMAMCVIYLRTQSLYIPIICHGLTNLAVWLETLGAMNIQDFGHVYTLSELQSEWYIGVIFGILSAIWMVLFFKGPQSTRVWKLPTI